MSDYGRIKKDGTFKNVLVTAPNTYQKSDKETITNFNEDEALMKEYGYKQVITTEPPYDENYETLTVESLTQDDENIYITYGVDRFANPPSGVDLSNYYTKQQVYNKKEIDSMLENLKNDSITTDDLYAVNAEIENLKANFAKIDMAEIDRLSTAYADIEELKSKLANIDTATIKNLTTEVGNIKLLLNGHLTSDNIESLVLTAKKVTVEDAFIKDAMIDTVNASKINTGVLNTNKVNIQSEDGSMTLKGNLQQFKDKNGKVRIQIGKDATGDFTFSLFNAEGTGVLIDENGIKSGAIGSGLIVDDMVSDNAHISGGKIDIDSLITNINGNESTINSSKIKFDDTNQTLDVAFGNLKTKVNTDLSSITQQVQSNSTNLNVQQGQISSLISNTTITTENGSTIQLKDAYNSTVSTVDSLINKMGKLETNVSSSLSKTETQYYTSTSSTALSGGEWTTDESPTWATGKYVWQRMKYTYSNGGIKYSTPVCIQGAKGEDGTGVNILDKYPSLEALKQAHPTGNPGDCYTVNGTLYTWSTSKKDWIDCGNIKGEKGDQGIQGIPGTPGNDGKTYYTWIKYADDNKGNGISNLPTGKDYIGFAYNKTTQTESNVPSDYIWSLIKGDKGDTGVKGDTGENGITYYTWIKYSDNPDGTGLYDIPKDSTMYIGIAINKITPTESNDKTDYTWSKFKGDKGDQGIQGIQGAQGEQGDQGIPGNDGKTTYFHIKYSANENGNPMTETPSAYIGTYVDYNPKDSTDYEVYKWSRFQGEQGEQGIPGINGENGLTYYLHIKYSDDGGKTFTSNNGETAGAYIGVYTDTNDKDSELVTKYTWSKIKGEKGDKGDQGLQGVPGTPGEDGKTYYTWIRYADTIDGSGISNDPTNKIYIGFAYNKETSTESNTPSDYTWSLIKGEKGDTGVQGVKGEDGKTYYTWIKYSDNADGTGLYDTPKNSTMYIGIATNKPTPNESSNKTDYVWSRFKGDKGEQGLQGVPGKDGKTYYTWIKYADDINGTGISDDPTGKSYIGLAYNKETQVESTNKTDYTWSLIKGEKGDTGIKGDTGADGTTYYTWIKYSDNADGTGLYDTPKDTTKYIGIGVNKTTPNESNNKTDYTWSKFKGEQGVKGEDGKTYYTWIKYADSVTGEGISNDPTGKTYIGLAYNKSTQTESDKPSDYIWSLIKGDKGDQGVQGIKGEDGVTHYTWIKYSDNEDGTGLYDLPKDSTMYIGIAPNKTTATESNNKADYIWSKFKGEKGDQGLQGVAGKDGKTYYTWIKYADDIDGTGISDDPTDKTYIGFAYNKTTATESTNKADYTWSLIKGEKGDQGIQGAKGIDGTTYYTWIKYSDNADGTGLYDTPKASTMYIGIAVNKTTQAESNNKTDYTWSRFKGEQGVKGENGKTYYTWIKYADDDKGNGISNEPTGKTYIGLAYNKTTQTESNTPSDYTWSLIKGDKGDTGVQGEKGKDGVTYYTWIKYSDNADGTGLYDVPKDTTSYIGIAINKTTPTESTNKTDYTWSRFKGDKGDKGEKGDQGIQGDQGQQGKPGEKGDTGQSMVSSTPQWYASTSATTQTGGSWLDSMPVIEVGKYYWLRYKQTWANPTKTTYTNPILEELGEAVKEVKSQQSNLEHTLDEFKQTVSNTYAKQTTVTDLTNKLAKDYTTTSDMNSVIDQKVDGVLTTVSKSYAEKKSVTDLNTKLEKNYYTSTQVNSAINQKANGILSTVSDSYAEKSTVNDLANNLSSNYTTTTNMNSAIEQKANGILNTVSKTYTTKDELKELSFGGRNYLLDTKNAKTIIGTKSANQCTNLYVLSDAKSSCNSEKMTLSFTYKVSSYTSGDFIIQTYGGSSKGWSRITPSSDGTFTYKHTIVVPANFDTATGVQIRMDAFVGTVEISNMMLEKGNTVSDWTPAPEDNASLIEDLGDYVLNITKETVIVSTDLSGNILS